MKHLLLPFFFLLGAQVALTQNWFTSHPVWVNYFTFGFGGDGVEIDQITGDTTIGGLTAQKVARKRTMSSSTINQDVRFVRQEGAAIWVLGSDNQFHQHYNFALAVGDTVSLPKQYSSQLIRYYIDSVGIMLVNGQNVRFQRIRFVQPFNSQVTCTALVLEGIGAVTGECGANSYLAAVHFFMDEPDESPVDGPQWTFCAFSNDQITYHSPYTICADLTPTKEVTTQEIRISPNPVQDVLHIQVSGDQAIRNIRIYDVSGKTVIQQMKLNDNQLNTNELSPGMYFLELQFSNGTSSVTKVVRCN